MKRYLIKITTQNGQHELLYGKQNRNIQSFRKSASVEDIIKYGYKTANKAQFCLDWFTNYNAQFGSPHKVEMIEVEV